MTAIAAAAITSAAIGGYAVYSGAKQKSDANKLAKNNVFTKEQLPGEVKQATNLAAQNYYNGMPGMATAQQKIADNGASAYYNGSQAASSGGDLLDLASKINQGQNVATNNLATQAAQYKSQALGGYENALGNEGQWQDKLYQNNELQPYLRTANTAAAMYGAGSQNEFAGLDQIASAGLGYASAKYNQDKTNKLLDLASSNPASTTITNNNAGSIGYTGRPAPSGPGIDSPTTAYQTGNANSYLPYTNLKPFSLSAAMAAQQLKKGIY